MANIGHDSFRDSGGDGGKVSTSASSRVSKLFPLFKVTSGVCLTDCSSHSPRRSGFVVCLMLRRRPSITKTKNTKFQLKLIQLRGETKWKTVSKNNSIFRAAQRAIRIRTVANPARRTNCLRDQNFIYFSQHRLKDIQKQSQLKNTIASPKIQRHQSKHKNNMDTTQNNVHVQRYDRVLTTEY